MKKFRLLSIITSALIATSLFAGCGSSGDGKSEKGGKSETVAVIVKSTMHEYWQTVKLGAENAGKDGDAKVVFKGPATETDVAGQVNLVEDAINQGVNGIVLAPSDVKALAPVVEKAVDKKIPVIVIDSKVDSDKISSFVATDNEAAAAKGADALAKEIGGKGKIAIVNFVAGAGTAIAREKGFADQIKSKYPDIQIVSTQYSEGDKAKALAITQDLITANPDLKGIFACNEGCAVGVARGIKEKGLTGKVKVVGFDSSKDEVTALKENVIQAMVVQNPYNMGYKGVKSALSAIKGEKVEKVIDTGSTVITKENLDTDEVKKLLDPLNNIK